MSTIVDIEIKQSNDGTFIGKLSSKYFDEPFIFTEFMDMIVMLDNFFDTNGFPERQLLPRTFGKSTRPGNSSSVGASLAKLEAEGQGDSSSETSFAKQYEVDGLSPHNFELSVKFRHKAEWQGSLLWREKGVTNHFSSIVELTRLINEVLTY